MSDDPAFWLKHLLDNERCELIKRGPVQIKENFPVNSDGRRFTNSNYFINMKNGEKISRSWLVYSVKNDSAVCFCCRIFGNWSNMFSGDGYSKWKNLSSQLKMHERSSDHKRHMENWHSLSERLKTNTAIDQVSQELLSLEVKHWKDVIRRLIAIVTHLAERNLAFCGHSDRLFEPGNGNFLGQIELMSQFDPVTCGEYKPKS